jgi:uncharacterized membrane protein HdeD (DUF308 family)
LQLSLSFLNFYLFKFNDFLYKDFRSKPLWKESYFMNGPLTHRFADVREIRDNWGWFFALGLLLILLGVGVIGSAYYATVFSIFLLGLFLIGGGAVQIVQAFMACKWSGLFFSLGIGILYLVVGIVSVANPTLAAVGFTLWIAIFCFVAGLFRMLAALIIRFDHWGWVFLNGLITFILGWLIYSQWPISGLWVIGLFLGIDLLLAGWTWVLLSLTARARA